MKKLPSEAEINADLRKLTEELRRLRGEMKTEIRQRTLKNGARGARGAVADERPPRRRASKKR